MGAKEPNIRVQRTKAAHWADLGPLDEVLAEGLVHIATIRHFDDVHDEFIILDFVENPEGSLADPIARMLPRELFASMRSRILSEFLNPLDYALTRFLLTDRFDLFRRRAFDDQLIACHCVSSS